MTQNEDARLEYIWRNLIPPPAENLFKHDAVVRIPRGNKGLVVEIAWDLMMETYICSPAIVHADGSYDHYTISLAQTELNRLRAWIRHTIGPVDLVNFMTDECHEIDYGTLPDVFCPKRVGYT